MRMRRRSFLHAFGAGVLGAHGSFALATQDTEAFEIPMLGDLHYDKLEHHDFEWMRSSHTGDIRQVENYSKVTREWSPRLMEVMKRRMTGQGRIPFLLQLGDLLEGLCGSEALAERQAKEAVVWVQEALPAVPFAMCKGNHDVTGPGATEVYDRVLVPFMNERLNGVDAARYTRTESGTLIVFYDAYDRTSLEWFTTLMAEKQPKRLIFVIHPPVVPYNARASWHVFAKPADAEKRTQLLDLLGKHRAVVLCGHLHKYSCVARTTSPGRSSLQLAASPPMKRENRRMYGKGWRPTHRTSWNWSPSMHRKRWRRVVRCWRQRSRSSRTTTMQTLGGMRCSVCPPTG